MMPSKFNSIISQTLPPSAIDTFEPLIGLGGVLIGAVVALTAT